jgi:hypothetical protein
MEETPESKAQSFTCFSLLPPETRHQIWECHLPCPRLIRVYTCKGEILYKKPGTDSIRRRRIFNHVWADKSPVPTVLQICQESRMVGLRHYTLAFDSNPRPSKETMQQRLSPRINGEPVFYFDTPAMIYVDLERDVILPRAIFDPYESYPSMPAENPSFFNHKVFLAEMKDILPKIRYFVEGFPWPSDMDMLLKSMPDLKGVPALGSLCGPEFRRRWESWSRIQKEYSTRHLTFRVFEREEYLRSAVENETIWDAAVEPSKESHVSVRCTCSRD